MKKKIWLITLNCAVLSCVIACGTLIKGKGNSTGSIIDVGAGIADGTYNIAGPFCVVDNKPLDFSAGSSTAALVKQASLGDLVVTTRTLTVADKKWTRVWARSDSRTTCSTTLTGELNKNSRTWIENKTRQATWTPTGCSQEVNDASTTGGFGTGTWVTQANQYGAKYVSVAAVGVGPTFEISYANSAWRLTLAAADALLETGYTCSDASKNIYYTATLPVAGDLGTVTGGNVNSGAGFTSSTRVLLKGTLTGDAATAVDFYFDSACSVKKGTALKNDFTAGTWFLGILTTEATTFYARPTGSDSISSECVNIGTITYDATPPTATCYKADTEASVEGCSPKMPSDMAINTVDQGQVNKTNIIAYTGDKSQSIIEWLTGPSDTQSSVVDVAHIFSSDISDPNSCTSVSGSWTTGVPTIANLEALTTYDAGTRLPLYTLCLRLGDGHGNYTYMGYWRQIVMVVP